jgi:predicted PurR-regulated permease PerM
MIKIAFVAALLVLAYYLYEVLIMVFVAFMLASLIDPLADKFEKYKIPRGLSVLLICAVLFGVLAGVVILLIPPILGQIREFTRDFAGYWEKATTSFASLEQWGAEKGLSENIQKSVATLETSIAKWIGSLFTTVTGIIGGIIAFVVVLVMTFYMVVEEEAMKKIIYNFLPKEKWDYTVQRGSEVKRKLGDWLRGQLVLCFIIGLFVYVGLLILGVDYALALGVFAGLMEMVPYAGPILGAMPAVFLAFAESPIKAFFVVVFYFIIQQLENNLLVPKVMQKAVGLNPVISIIALLIGAKLAGFVGVLLAIPLTTAASVFVKDFYFKE